jgi:hypothetical protein
MDFLCRWRINNALPHRTGKEKKRSPFFMR